LIVLIVVVDVAITCVNVPSIVPIVLCRRPIVGRSQVLQYDQKKLVVFMHGP